MLRIILALAVTLALSACASTKLNENHKASTDAFATMHTQQSLALQKLSDTSACGTDGRCVENVKSVAALALVAVGASGGSAQVPVHVEQYHPLWGLVGRALDVGIREAGATVRAGYARDQFGMQVEGQTRQAEAAFGLGTAAVQAANQTASAYADSLSGLAPSINVNGNYGDTISAGRDMWGDQNRVGDDTRIRTGAINTGTQNTGGVIGSGQVGNGRQNAPGPFGNIGPQCQGEGCQQVTPPPPPPPIDPEG